MPPKGKDGKKEKKKVPLTPADKGCEYIRAGEQENLVKIISEDKKYMNKHEVKSGKNMLHVAVEEGKLDFVDILVDYGAKINFRTKDQQTPLMLAANIMEDDILSFLISSGCNIFVSGKLGDTALHIATRRGYISTIKLLLKEMEAVVTANEERVRQEELESLEEELENKGEEEDGGSRPASPQAPAAGEAPTPGGMGMVPTPDSPQAPAAPTATLAPPAAAEPGAEPGTEPGASDPTAGEGVPPAGDGAQDVEVAEDIGDGEENFLSMKDHMETKNDLGETVLSMAIKMQHWEIAKLFLELGADINTVGMNGNTPLTRSVFDGRLPSVKFCLDQKGCDLEHKNMNEECAIVIAIKQKYFKIADYLIKEHKADIESKDMQGNTPLLFGALMNNFDIVEYCLKHGGANIDATNNWGATAAMIVCKMPKGEKVLDLLIEYNADLNIQDRNYWTALMFSCRLDDIWRADKLLLAGADPDLRNNIGQTALQVIPDHNVINERGNIELHNENVLQYQDSLSLREGLVKPLKDTLVPRSRPEWIDRQIRDEAKEARDTAHDKWVHQVKTEEEEMEKQELQQELDEERQILQQEAEEKRQKEEWDALPDEEKEKITRTKAKAAQKARLAQREEWVKAGLNPDIMEEQERKKAEARKTMENRLKKESLEQARKKREREAAAALARS